MRKDKGLNGDLDRLPMLAWIMFLKFLDDRERVDEERAVLAGRTYRPIVDPPYRWRDWAATEDGITGPDLLAFLSSEDVELSDGTRGSGLFTYLRALQGDDGERERRDVIATVFRGFTNRMESGYLLRDVVNLIGGIHFDSSEEVQILGHLYETLLREMRDAAGDSGEFYTPRPVVRFMVDAIDPQLGETVLDPACGTGGFLCETFQHLERQADTIEKRRVLQRETLLGCEAKSLPFLLVQLNLLLHGLHTPRIDPGNALRFRLSEIGEGQRVNVILTNPPFGGEEEAGILRNFPKDGRTAETAHLFLQLIMRRLKRAGRGRAAVVVPNGTLFGDGICARIKGDLLERFNLHTVVRLPEGVFAPYTDIPTNVIFFDTSGPTRAIWYYEQPRPEGRRKYTKTMPLTYDDLTDCRDWWRDRKKSQRAWRVAADGLVRRGDDGNVVACNLDIKNPHRGEVEDDRTPLEIVGSIIERERAFLTTMDSMKAELANRPTINWPTLPIGEIARPIHRKVTVEPEKPYRLLGMRSQIGGPFVRETKFGAEISASSLNQVRSGDFIYSRLFAWQGSFGVVPEQLDGAFVSGEFPLFQFDSARVDVRFLVLWFGLPRSQKAVEADCFGSTPGTRNRYKEQYFLRLEVPVPPLDEQQRIVARLDRLRGLIDSRHETAQDIDALFLAALREAFAASEHRISDSVGTS
ncbi:MAG: N-6 DNA methylase [Gemmatimonadota bacterium]|nr:N-6 DNA methylase [Gemmatimonadota bacterium]